MPRAAAARAILARAHPERLATVAGDRREWAALEQVARPEQADPPGAQPARAEPGRGELVEARRADPGAPAAFPSIAPGLSPARAPFTGFRMPCPASRAWIRTKC